MKVTEFNLNSIYYKHHNFHALLLPAVMEVYMKVA